MRSVVLELFKEKDSVKLVNALYISPYILRLKPENMHTYCFSIVAHLCSLDEMLIDINIVTCQVHPILVKTGQMCGPFFFKKFVGSYYMISRAVVDTLSSTVSQQLRIFDCRHAMF